MPAEISPLTSARSFPSDSLPQSSLVNGFRVLESFATGQSELGVSEVARRVGLHKSTVSRIMATLAQMDYLSKDPETAKYRLGISLLTLAAPLLESLDIRVVAHPCLRDATEATGETSALAVVSDPGLVVVDQVASSQFVKHTQSIGTQYRDWGSASVRVMLARMPASRALQLLASEILPDANLADDESRRNALMAELDSVRAAGYAINDGDSDPFEFGVSSPVFDINGDLAGAVVLSAPRARVSRELRAKLIKETLKTAREISGRLGYSFHSVRT